MIPLNNFSVVNTRVLAAGEKYALCYRRGSLYKMELSSMSMSKVATIPGRLSIIVFSKMALTERLFRLAPRAAIALDETSFIFSHQGFVYKINVESGSIAVEHSFRPFMNNPLSFVRLKGIDGFDDSVIYGEYFSNNKSESVSIWQRRSGGWEKVFTFPQGTVYHIHSIIPDQVNQCVYVLVGDNDIESGIWKITKNFESAEKIAGGSQQFRSCVGFPFNGGLLYATDTPRERNHIYQASFVNSTWSIVSLYDMPGPSIFGKCVGQNMYFATSVEADDTLPSFIYRVSYRLGNGISDRYCHIIKVTPKGLATEVATFRKDIWPMLLFQFGNCLFPDNLSDNTLILCPQAVRNYHGKSLIFDVTNE